MTHAYLRYVPPLPKPKDKPRPDLAPVKVYRDGRERCITSLSHPMGSEGRKEYNRRKALMHQRQGGTATSRKFRANPEAKSAPGPKWPGGASMAMRPCLTWSRWYSRNVCS